ncbi:dCTP deaminase domain-containing protein [Stratiformator vulcanicus]|uniref:Deoxycytidine triphosphate deaminase n=1 Tax=Stratiformator vulcanicus TaxID=2527980 RepID=A0A517QWF2_9PLAN|nr:hypothetical protein [Stratiformator vulcanicus]QDT35961.1 Deoxycytidine triphosphate deaminase [Stratiformator vulcanicus]
MTFWRTETMRERIPAEQLIAPYREEHVTRSAYELCQGSEAFITSTENKVKIELAAGKSLVIPPGQFALLLTEERINVPMNAIAFISMRFGVKRRGLINVSGFHVDPGFEGRLKFSVYNAGSSDITITQGDRVFLIWYANLDDNTTDGYPSAGPDQDKISSDDQNVMHGEIASPAELRSQIEVLRREVDSKTENLKHLGMNIKLVLTVFLSLVVAILLRLFFMSYFAAPSSSDIEQLRIDVIKEMRKELLELEENSRATSESQTEEQDNVLDRRPDQPNNEGDAVDNVDVAPNRQNSVNSSSTTD